MKNIKYVRILSILLLITFVTMGYSKFFKNQFFKGASTSSQYTLEEQANIIAVWTSEEDSNYKLDFKSNGMCYKYYQSSLVATYSYSISNSSPQCGMDVLIDPTHETSYLQFVNQDDGSTECYEVNGVGELLSITQLGTSNLVIFYK